METEFNPGYYLGQFEISAKFVLTIDAYIDEMKSAVLAYII